MSPDAIDELLVQASALLWFVAWMIFAVWCFRRRRGPRA